MNITEIDTHYRKEKIKILEDHVAFANLEPDDRSLKRKGFSIIKRTRVSLGLIYDGELDQVRPGHIEKVHELLNDHIEAMTQGYLKEVKADNLTVLFSGGRPLITHDGHNPESEICNMYLLLIYTGVKKIIRCPGCGKAFLATRTSRLSCSSKCRKRKSINSLKKK